MSAIFVFRRHEVIHVPYYIQNAGSISSKGQQYFINKFLNEEERPA